MITSDDSRLGWAAAVVLAYLLFCTWTWWRRRKQHAEAVAIGGAAPMLLVYASQTGFAEELARRSASLLQAAGRSVRLLSIEQLDAPLLASARQALFVLSTTGEGDAPDAAAGFLRKVMAKPQALPDLRYGLLALGDSSYKQFCGFGRQVDAWLRQSQAAPLFEAIEVDNGHDAALQAWLRQLQRFGAVAEGWKAPGYRRWQLQGREWLNPGSPGGPAYHIFLSPPDDSENGQWQAGDIVEILPGIAEDVASPPEGQQHREYSIASLPADGGIALLVRRMDHPDGRLGLGSGWLTQIAEIGGGIALRIRSNSGFHPPEGKYPLILIGNGTGLAGLLAHLKARRLAGHNRNWLIFGERTAAHDFFFRQQIEAWHAEGSIEKLDLAFSRDQAERRYVQHCLREQAASLRQWVAEGASIYVCGSRHGMAGDVEAALVDVLGAEAVQVLRERGRYRRDVY